MPSKKPENRPQEENKITHVTETQEYNTFEADTQEELPAAIEDFHIALETASQTIEMPPLDPEDEEMQTGNSRPSAPILIVDRDEQECGAPYSQVTPITPGEKDPRRHKTVPFHVNTEDMGAFQRPEKTKKSYDEIEQERLLNQGFILAGAAIETKEFTDQVKILTLAHITKNALFSLSLTGPTGIETLIQILSSKNGSFKIITPSEKDIETLESDGLEENEFYLDHFGITITTSFNGLIDKAAKQPSIQIEITDHKKTKKAAITTTLTTY